MRIATPAFICFSFARNIFFHPITFSLYVSLGLKWVTCRQHIYGYCCCIHSASLCLLVGVFNPLHLKFSSVQLLSYLWLFVTPWTAACQTSLSITNSRSLLKLMSIESVMPSNHLILCRPFLLLLSIIPSIRVFSNESVLSIRWPKYWSFSFSISPSNEYAGPISFSMDWLYLLAVQGILKSLFQRHSSKRPILCHSTFLIVQLSHPYMTTEKNHSLD